MNSRRSNRWSVFWTTLCLSFFFVSAPAPSNAETAEEQLVSANTGFGFRLLKELAREQARANIFISPYSVSSVLQMVGNGARGQTQQELQQVLGTIALSTESMNSAYAALNQSIGSAQSNLVLNIANAIWYRRGAQLSDGFSAANEKYYHAELAGLDFSDPASVQRMNQWAADNTQGRIDSIIQPPIPPETALVLANAIYFKGTWLNQFDPKQTRQRTFHLAGGGDPQVPMMEQTRAFSYQTGPGFQAVQLFYTGKRLEMEILLPETNSTLEALLGQVDEQSWQNALLPGFREHKGTLVLPRLKFRYGAELKKPLATLGLKSALTPAADFSAMSASRLFLSEVKHQSFVEVNEQGTEAAAVTTGVVALASLRNPPQPFQMVVDRPFLFLISDQVTKSILFMGLVFDPR
jgi:serine protease inhibitor